MQSFFRGFLTRMWARPGRSLLILAGLLVVGGAAYWGGRHCWAWYHYHAAQRALENRNLQAARNHLAKCLEVWPQSGSTHFLAARTARRCDCFDAIDFFGSLTPARMASLDQAMDHLEAAERLGSPAEGISLEWDLLRAQQGSLPQVEKKLFACIKQGHADAFFIFEVLSWELMRAHRLGEALQVLDHWLTEQPSDRDALIRRGWVQEHLMNPRAAVDDYQKALDIDPEKDRIEDDRLRFRLAEILLERNQPNEAAKHWEVLYDRHSTQATVVLSLARCRRQQHQMRAAEKLLTDLLARQPQDGKALGERGRLALDLGHAREAETWLRKAIARCPHDREIIYDLFRSLQIQKKGEAAKYSAHLKQIRKDERTMSRLMVEVLKSPNDPELCCRIGKIFFRNGMDRSGHFWLNKALRLDGNYQPAHQALARYYQRIGKKGLAKAHYRIPDTVPASPARARQ